MVVYDIDTGERNTVWDLGSDYNREYATVCPVATGDTSTHQLAFIGVWRVIYTLNGTSRSTTWYDTLGAYGSQQSFDQHRSQEIAAREAIILDQTQSRGWQDVSVTLLIVNSMPVSDRYLSH
jgi:hypothetical protein